VEAKNIGIIGCGERLRVVTGLLLKQASGLRVSALSDPSSESVEKTKAAIAPDATAYEDHRDLLADPKIDWVMIGSWNCYHREHAVAALKAGKHVFCEKPLATNVEDALAIRDAVERSDRHFVLGFPLRYTKHYRKIYQLITGGAIGKIISLEFNETLDFNHGAYIHQDWRRWTRHAGTHLLEKCCHDVDIVNWCVGALPARVASFGGLRFFTPDNAYHIDRVGPNPDTGLRAYQHYRATNGSPFRDDKDIVDHQIAIIEYQNGVKASFHTNCNAALPERRAYILGSEGTIRADLMTGRVELKRIGWDEPTTVFPSVAGGHGGGDEVMVQKLARVMCSGAEAEEPFDQALSATLTCFAIDEALQRGEVVDLRPYWAKAGMGDASAAQIVTRRLEDLFQRTPASASVRRRPNPHSV
jgi:predicted dehydrogenase